MKLTSALLACAIELAGTGPAACLPVLRDSGDLALVRKSPGFEDGESSTGSTSRSSSGRFSRAWSSSSSSSSDDSSSRSPLSSPSRSSSLGPEHLPKVIGIVIHDVETREIAKPSLNSRVASQLSRSTSEPAGTSKGKAKMSSTKPAQVTDLRIQALHGSVRKSRRQPWLKPKSPTPSHLKPTRSKLLGSQGLLTPPKVGGPPAMHDNVITKYRGMLVNEVEDALHEAKTRHGKELIVIKSELTNYGGIRQTLGHREDLPERLKQRMRQPPASPLSLDGQGAIQDFTRAFTKLLI